jgi:hypothetical protein
MAGKAFSYSADTRSTSGEQPPINETPSYLTGPLLIDIIDAASTNWYGGELFLWLVPVGRGRLLAMTSQRGRLGYRCTAAAIRLVSDPTFTEGRYLSDLTVPGSPVIG